MQPEPHVLDSVFGPGEGSTTEARARSSTRCFVRGLDQLAEDSPEATGRRLTAREALESYGIETLVEVAADGSTRLAHSADAAGLPLRRRREQLALEVKTVAKQARVTVEEVKACEASKRLPLRTYEKIARALGLDERFVAVRDQPTGNNSVAVRLRSIGDEAGLLNSSSVATLAEAAWVATTQGRLAAQLGFRINRHGLTQNPSFGTPDFPAYRWGYHLASESRKAFGIPENDPLPSIRSLIEDQIGVALIHCELGESLAGATIETGEHRAIVINLSGANRSVFVRRITMAHELGHFLFDPVQQLDALCVDEYEGLERAREEIADPVEQRANAFAVEFLAPQSAILPFFEKERDLTAVVGHFGVGAMPARHQIRNASKGSVRADHVRLARPDSDEWRKYASFEGSESLAILDLHPISGIRPSRAGRFSALVVRAAEERIISWDSAAAWLETSEPEVRAAAEAIKELYPNVWR